MVHIVIISFSLEETFSSTVFMWSSVIVCTFFSNIFSSSSPISLDFRSFLSSSLASLLIFLIETLHFSPIDLIIFFNSVLRSSFNSGTGNLISCPSICGLRPKSDFLTAESTKETN